MKERTVTCPLGEVMLDTVKPIVMDDLLLAAEVAITCSALTKKIIAMWMWTSDDPVAAAADRCLWAKLRAQMDSTQRILSTCPDPTPCCGPLRMLWCLQLWCLLVTARAAGALVGWSRWLMQVRLHVLPMTTCFSKGKDIPVSA